MSLSQPCPLRVGNPHCHMHSRTALLYLCIFPQAMPLCVGCCTLQDAFLSGRPVEGYPHYAVQHKAPSQSVIGSQPVSLDRENLELLRRKRWGINRQLGCVARCLVADALPSASRLLVLSCKGTMGVLARAPP